MLLSRKELEDREEKFLAPYAVKSKYSKGRKYKEKESDNRTCFQKDRDRIIHSRAFRRLKGKTQVFIAGEGDHFRTRLTHSLEVAQVARDVARSLALNEDLAEAVALAHDLGHPPFAHAGQDMMNEMMKKYGLEFEHNEQSKRMVEYFENIYPDFRGLNLSHESLEGLMKHQTIYDNVDKKFSVHPSLEAQIVDMADEIAYTCHDIDDGLRSGIITLNQLQKIPLCIEAIEKVKKNYGELPKNLKIHNARLVSAVMTLIINDLLNQTEKNIKEYKIKSLDDVYKSKLKIVDFSKNIKGKLPILRKFLYEKFYMHKSVVKLSKEGQDIIKKLFEHFEKNPNLLPEDFKREIKDEKTKAIAIKDYIAGMTDDFAKELVA